MSDWVDEVAKKLRKSKDGSELTDDYQREWHERAMRMKDKHKDSAPHIWSANRDRLRVREDKQDSIDNSEKLSEELSGDVHSDLIDGNLEKALSKVDRLNKIKKRIKNKKHDRDVKYKDKPVP